MSRLTLPDDDQEASQYVRLAVRAYPELYFARFVVLAEGASEQIVIPRLAEAMGVPLDPSFVPIVPLAGRYINHFWTLLGDLKIPFATLLDLDLGRTHGGVKTIQKVVAALEENENDLSENFRVKLGMIDPDNVDELEDDDLLDGYEENNWLQALKDEGVFFSYPLDLDFSMVGAFPDEYHNPNPGGRGPRRGDEVIAEKKAVTLKTGGNPDLYDEDYDDQFIWYPYLFLNRSKPETHLLALSEIDDESLRDDAPPELKALINHIKKALGLNDEDGGE